MTVRQYDVHLLKPFKIAGLEECLPAGRYSVTEEVLTPEKSLPRATTHLVIPDGRISPGDTGKIVTLESGEIESILSGDAGASLPESGAPRSARPETV